MNMAKKQNSFSSTKRDRNGENVPAIAGVEINEIRMYSIEGKMYLPETDLPKLEYRLKAKNFIAERFTGMTDSYGIPIFEGDVIYQEYWLENMKLDMWHFVCWDEKLGCFIARCCNQDGVAEYDDPYDRNGYAPMLREWVEGKTVIGNIHCHNTSKDGCTITDFYKYASPSPYSGIVADREICIKKEYPDEFNKSIFVWSYSPFKSQWSIQLRKKEFPPHYIIFPAPTADEIISKLPHDWYGVDHCFIFQGQLFHFCPIYRNREVEDNLPDPVAIRLFFREQLDPLNKRPHELLPLHFGGCFIDLIECQQQAVDIITRNFLLPDAPYLALHVVNLDFDLIYSTILLVIAALQIRNFPVIIRVIYIQIVHLPFQTGFCTQSLPKLRL